MLIKFLAIALLFISFVINSSPLTTDVNNEKAAECPEFFLGDPKFPCYTLGTSCYCFSSFKVPSWMRSQEYCQMGNMTLATVESEEETRLINNHVAANPELNRREYWIAGHYSQEGNERWEWADKEPFRPMNYTNWHGFYNQPNDDEAGSCALLYFLDLTGYWCDNVCIYSCPFLCELEL